MDKLLDVHASGGDNGENSEVFVQKAEAEFVDSFYPC